MPAHVNKTRTQLRIVKEEPKGDRWTYSTEYVPTKSKVWK